MKRLFSRAIALFSVVMLMLQGQAQDATNLYNEWQWQQDSAETAESPYTAQFQLNKDGSFVDKSNNAGGTFILQNLTLQLAYSYPTVIARTFTIEQITNDELVLKKGNAVFNFVSPNNPAFQAKVVQVAKQVDNKGVTGLGVMRGLLGIAVLLLIALVFSTARKKIHWKTVAVGIGLQLLLAVLILKGESFYFGFVGSIFDLGGKFFTQVLGFTREGSSFLLSGFMDIESYGFIFLFQVLPILIFFSALTSVLFYLGIIQKIVRVLAWGMAKIMKVSGPESLSVAGNIFLGQTESPLMIKEYLANMSRSEILLVMIGGMATVAGSVLGAYIGFLGGDDLEAQRVYAKHLLAASVMAAPGAIVVSKILMPQTTEISKDVNAKVEKTASNFLDALSNGTTEGLKLAANVGAMLLVFIAFIAMLNAALMEVGDWFSWNAWIVESTQGQYSHLSLEFLLGYLFAPLMWLIGVPNEDLSLMGQLLGVKIVASEFVGYINLASMKDPSSLIHLTHQKSIIMATYMLCGFANFASIGIQIGGIGMLAPSKKKWLSEFGMRALLGGTLASLISATIAGMLIG